MENKNAIATIKEAIQLTITERFFLLKMKKDEQDIRFLRTLRYARWDSAAFCWVISRKEENLTMIRNYFGVRLTEDNCEGQSLTRVVPKSLPDIEASTLLVVKYHNGWVKLIFRYEKELVRLIKTLPLYAWDKENLWWTIAHTEGVLAKLASFCDQNG